MKVKALILLTAILLVSAFAMAETGTITLRDPVTVNGKQLAAGDYKVQWNGNGELNFLQGKKTVATAKVTVKELPAAAKLDRITLRTENGTRTIAEIQFGGKKTQLVLE
jgi:lipopolysaccharide export system protein LptA